LRIFPIYFLGEGLPDIKGHGAVRVERTCFDAFTGELLEIKDNFIEKITHDALIICANELRGAHATGLQKLLSIFNLAAQFKYSHFLIIDEDDYSEEYRPIIRRLQKAAETANVRRYMDDEDDYLTQLVAAERGRDAANALSETLRAQIQEAAALMEQQRIEHEALIAEKKRLSLENERVEKENERVEKENERVEKENERVEKENERVEKEKERVEKEKSALQTQSEHFIQMLVQTGLDMHLSPTEIAAKFNIPIADVRRNMTK
jgi:flagellar biosynthesis GTPase FlhF